MFANRLRGEPVTMEEMMDDGYEEYSNLTQDELLTEIGRMLMAGAIHGQPVNDSRVPTVR